MIDKELQEKWEKRLQRYGLGIDQPMTDNSDGELEQVSSMPSARGEKHPNHARLRTKIDSNDQFLTGGFEVKKIRAREHETPEWALSNKKVQEILLKAFPTLHKTKPSRARAARWASVIYLYYRMGLPQQVVMRELKMTKPVFRTICQRVEAIAKTGIP